MPTNSPEKLEVVQAQLEEFRERSAAVIAEMLRYAKSAADAKKTLKRDFSLFRETSGLSVSQVSLLVATGDSPRFDDAAPFLAPDWSAFRQILKMKQTTFDSWLIKVKEAKRRFTAKEVSAFRSEVEPNYGQIWRKKEAEKRQAHFEDQTRHYAERELEHPHPTWIHPLEFIRRHGGEDCQPLLLVSSAGSPVDRLAIKIGSIYMENLHFKVVPSREGNLYVDQFKKIVDEVNHHVELDSLEEVQPEPIGPTYTHAPTYREANDTPIPLPEFLASLWERPPRVKINATKYCPSCELAGRMKPISANKELCRECADAANLVIASGRERQMDAHA